VRACAIVPAFCAERTIAGVLVELRAELGLPVIVVDDGSTDGTAVTARAAGARVIAHASNRGKGRALRTALAAAHADGFEVAVSVDADGQHPARSARRVLEAAREQDPGALVLGVRDLAAAGAPAANQWSNGVSNYWLSLFLRRAMRDTQCGLRRYPIARTLALGARADGYAFEAEVLLRAAHAGVPIVEQPIDVVYPPESERVSHFDPVRDPARIVVTVLRTLAELRRQVHTSRA
jgi:glycosyltransferase involved in cell wall biosynthesis